MKVWVALFAGVIIGLVLGVQIDDQPSTHTEQSRPSTSSEDVRVPPPELMGEVTAPAPVNDAPAGQPSETKIRARTVLEFADLIERLTPEEVVDRALALPPGTRNLVLGEVLLALGDDFSVAQRLELLQAHPDVEQPFRGLADFLTGWQELEQLADQNARTAVQHIFLQDWARVSPREALTQTAKTVKDGPLAMAFGTLLMDWSRKSPREAIDWAVSQNQAAFSYHTGIAMAEVTRRSAAEALEIWAGFPPAVKHRVGPQYFVALADADTDALLTLLPELKGSQAQFARRVVLGGLVKHDVDRALMWLDELDQDERKQALRSVSMFSRSNPDQFARFTERLEDPKERRQMQSQLVSFWAMQDPDQARTYVMRADLDTQRALIGNLMMGWGRSDPQSAVSYARTLADPATRDAGLVALTRSVQDFELMDTLYQEISSTANQLAAARRLLRQANAHESPRAEFYRQEVNRLTPAEGD